MEFIIEKQLGNGLGRAGIIKTAHGDIKTPAFMSVGTHGFVRFVPPEDLRAIGAQAMLSNGFHLRRESPSIAAAGGLANWIPTHDDNCTQAASNTSTSHHIQLEPSSSLSSDRASRQPAVAGVVRPTLSLVSSESSSESKLTASDAPDKSARDTVEILKELKDGTRDEVKVLEELKDTTENMNDCNTDASGRSSRSLNASLGTVSGCFSKALDVSQEYAWLGPTLTDSGGFQVMSLGSGLGKVVSMERERGVINTAHKDRLAHVEERGVSFIDPFDGQPDFIGPEESMQIQCRIGADIHMAFDELTSLADTYEYNIEAKDRTERWAERSLREHLKHRDNLGYRQNLYAVLQGGRWEDLRRSTARNLATISVNGNTFDGFGLGGAFLKEDLGEILRWCNEELPVEKPRHLLGLSHPDDILIGTAMGADTFDCVAPTREARHGKIYTRHGSLNLRQFRDVSQPLDPGCDCPTCRAGWTLGSLRALWRSGDRDQKEKYFHLASMHNLRFIIRLTEEIRASIIGDYFEEYKTSFLRQYYDIM